MATKYKLISRARQTRKTTDLGKYDVPVEVVGLVEDMARIEHIIALLRLIDVQSITASDTQEQRDYGDLMLKSQRTLARSWQRYARRRLQKYLAP
jgi:hypothetical protein